MEDYQFAAYSTDCYLLADYQKSLEIAEAGRTRFANNAGLNRLALFNLTELNRFPEAIAAGNALLASDKVKLSGNDHLYLGMAYSGNKDYDKAIDAILPNIFQPQDAVAVLGEDYQGPVNTPDVISYMHETPSAMRKEFYLVKTLSCEKQNIANSISTGAQSQGAILRISNIRFFLKQA